MSSFIRLNIYHHTPETLAKIREDEEVYLSPTEYIVMAAYLNVLDIQSLTTLIYDQEKDEEKPLFTTKIKMSSGDIFESPFSLKEIHNLIVKNETKDYD